MLAGAAHLGLTTVDSLHQPLLDGAVCVFELQLTASMSLIAHAIDLGKPVVVDVH